MKYQDITLSKILCPSVKNYIDESQLNRLRESIYPNYIFGGGGWAISVANTLMANNVRIDGFCESKYYYSEGRILLNKPVYLFDEISNQSQPHNIIIAATGNGVHSIIDAEERNGNDIYVFDAAETLFQMSYEWVYEHIEELEKSFELFHDDLSKETFLSFIHHNAHCINADIRPLWKLWISDQYFNDLYIFENFNTHALLDCGAWIGDTAEEFLYFLRNAGYDGKVYSFEPDPKNYQSLQATAKRIGNIECYPFAVGSKRQDVSFCAENSSTSHLSNNNDGEGVTVSMVPVDELLYGKKISLVKMDLEGGEEDALNGMKNIIIDNLPMLAICVYHKIDDLIRIPNCINSIISGADTKYSYFLRHHSCSTHELVLYAVPDSKLKEV